MKRHAPSQCPVCNHQMDITHLYCERCNTELSGKFAPCRFCAMEEKQLLFIETFLKCRGSIKEVEKALGVSYPTVKNMLENALNALGLDSVQQTESGSKNEILAQLSNGEIDVNIAVEKLRRLQK